MSQRISESQVRHVARLARLKITEEQVTRFTQQLGDILNYVAKLEEVDVSDVEPMAHPTDLCNQLRDDVPEPPMPLDEALANAPAVDRPFFKVPKVIGEGPGA